MIKRSPIGVFFFPFITFGIYSLVWLVMTKNEMNRKGDQIPTAWLLIIPFVNIWWLWKYSEGVEKVTNGKLGAALTFVLVFLLGIIGPAIIQDHFNKIETPAATTEPLAGVSTVLDNSSNSQPIISDENPSSPPPA